MKRNILLIPILIISLLFEGCSDDKAPVPPPPIQEGTAELVLRFGSIKTKADGDEVATDAEKEIRSLACFVQTNGDGTEGSPEYKEGGFGKYFSNSSNEDTQLEEELAETGEKGTYTATIRIHSESFKGASKVFFLANYAENGFTDAELEAIASWDDLLKLKTKAVTQSPTTPLLMSVNEEVTLVEGDTQYLTVLIQRIVSRIDVIYLQENEPADGSKKFKLESVQVINPKSQACLAQDDGTETDNIPIVASFPAVSPTTEKPNEIRCMYVYPATNTEISNGGVTAPTMLRIKGTYNNTYPIDKTIPFEAADGSIVPLANNYYYQVILNPPGENLEMDLTFKIDDWTDAEEFHAGPTQDPLVLNDIAITPSPAGNSWDEATRTLDITNITADMTDVTFNAIGNSSTQFYVITRYDKNATSLGYDAENNLVESIVQQGAVEEIADPVTGVISYKQEYTISIPKQLPDRRVPLDVVVYIHDEANDNNRDSIVFRSMPDYQGTLLKPVLVGGIYWAPVNVGATTINGTNTFADIGYVFQWGRNEPFQTADGTDVPQSDIIPGPVSYNDANGQYKNSFIAAEGVSDWLISEDPDMPTRNLRWTKNVNDSPCPKGWRIPRKDELDILLQMLINGDYSNEQDKHCFSFTGDNKTDILYVGLTGWRNWNTGTSTGRGSSLQLWSSSINSERLAYRIDAGRSYYSFTSYGFGIRCVQE